MTILGFLVGASVGSFLNVAADRLPAGQSLIRPRSFCPACKTPLGHLDLVPIASHLWLRGRCRYCSAPIPLRTLLVEVMTGALFALVILRYGAEIESLIILFAVSLLIVIAIIDLEYGLILNSILFPGVVAALILAPFWSEVGLSRSFLNSHSMLASFLNSLLAGGGAYLLFLAIALVYPSGMGGGDVKLAGLVGLLAGFPGVLIALWLSVISGGLVAVALLLAHRKGRKDAIPFGPFLALGAIVSLLAGSEVLSWYKELAAKAGGL